MRHRKKLKKIGLPKDHRKSLLRNLTTSLVINGQLKTTMSRARALASHFARLMRTLQQRENREAIRMLPRFISAGSLGVSMGKKIAALKAKYEGRASGFTRITPMGLRRGDGATLVQIELL